GPYSSQWQAAMDAEMASWKSTGTYVDEVPPPGANIVSGMCIFRGVDFFQTFSPTPKMTTLRVLLHVAAQRDYKLHLHDFSTAFLQGSLHEEIWLRRPPGFTGSFPAGTQWSLRRPVYGLRQAPREWHDTLRTTLAALACFAFLDWSCDLLFSPTLPMGVSAAAVEAVAVVAAAGVAEAVEVAEAAEAVVELVAELHRGVAPVVVSASSSSAVLRPPPLSSFVSGTLGVSAVEVLAPAPTFSVPETALFPDAIEIPRWGDLSRAWVAVFDLDYDAILAAMYALSTSDEGDCYLCVPPDPGIEAAALGAGETAALGASAYAALGAGESAPSGTASAQVFHTFTLDSGASRSFFRDRTTLTPLSRPVAVSLADPSGGPVLASFSTVLPCPAAPSGSLSGLYLPSFSTNLSFVPQGVTCTMSGCSARVGGALSMSGGAIEELAIGVVSVVGVADVVSAAVDVVASCRIVAYARVLSASEPSSTVENLELLCGAVCFKMDPHRHQLADAQ
ncbi:unnamed protein product, partial [Closterium sp. NIES-53]